jgi:NAD(P)-dependent dehydrogenase (short-subunit alcohol dehydrogenase family)
MAKKIALVTGATRGIGLETVRQLAQKDVHVILAGRDKDKAEKAAQKLRDEKLDVESLALDVTDSKSIAAAAKEVDAKHGHLDILINNAGILVDDFKKKPSEQTIDAWRTTFDTNVFGLVETTQAFLPLIKKSSAGRIVNVSSILGSLTLHSQPDSPIYDFKVPAYNTSKSAVNAWTVELAYELRDTPIKVNTIHPGYVKTDMNAGEGAIEIPEGAKTSVELALIGNDGPTGSYSHLGQTLPW